MRQVRSSVFETNSSSVHAIAFSMGGMEESNLPMTRDGKVKVRYGKFGREEAEYNDQETKLSYLITLCYYIANGDEVEGEYHFREIEDAVMEYIPNCTGIKIVGGEPGLDHQSYPEYGIEIINIWDHDAVQNYIFNPNIYLTTGSD